ncbi:MAG: hypothetical protein CYPHOPRED_002093 [Cyphobasidiales sp. Tagirdzhanova-0007]|nr:MAG: hypothetical protein CYPHOPRED_002093 [Cyphobasidiales sp. Tagirdzhanova-0007]
MGACGSKAGKSFSGEGNRLTNPSERTPAQTTGSASASQSKSPPLPTVQHIQPQGNILGSVNGDQPGPAPGSPDEIRRKRLEAIEARTV